MQINDIIKHFTRPRTWTDPLAQDRQVASCCKCDNEPSGYIKYGEFLYWLRYCWLLRMDHALRYRVRKLDITIQDLMARDFCTLHRKKRGYAAE
jgi:hypothetical protein